MRRLLIMRHAKSAYPADVADDSDRPLNGRGQRDAPLMGQLPGMADRLPERVLCSPAVRARQTAEAVLAAAGLPSTLLQFDERLYLATADDLEQVLCEVPGGLRTVLLVGHNPGLEYWVQRLCGARVRLPTAALACIDAEAAEWAGMAVVGGQLQWLQIPRLSRTRD